MKRLETSLNRSSFTIAPDGNFRSTWDLISCLLIIHCSLIIPLQTAFEDFNPRYLNVFDTISDIWFIVDVILNFNQNQFYNEKTINPIAFLKLFRLVRFLKLDKLMIHVRPTLLLIGLRTNNHRFH